MSMKNDISKQKSSYRNMQMTDSKLASIQYNLLTDRLCRESKLIQS